MNYNIWAFRTLIAFSFSGLMFYSMSLEDVLYRGIFVAITGGFACWNFIEAMRGSNE